MSESDKQIHLLSGMRDVMPDEYELRQRVWKTISTTFEKFGYRGVEVPTIELMELHLRKSGESIRQHMYFFNDQGQNDLCLRPELTASVVRMYNEGLQNELLPLKLYYVGSAFRHDRPQIGRYREFTQAGIELIGGKTPEFDAEVIALACHVMDALGISDYKVVIGNIGIVLELLSQKKIEERAKNYIVEKLETFSKIEASSKEDTIQKWQQDMKAGLEKIGISLDEPSQEKMALLDIVKRLPEDDITTVVAWVLQTIYGMTEQKRSSKEIAKNLIAKIMRGEQVESIMKTLEFISRLMSIDESRPEEVLRKADTLIQEYNLDAKPIDELRQIACYLETYGIDWNKVRIDFGFGRGLEYYTGMIFEIYVDTNKLGASQKQVCGGGRYDTLIADLGSSRPVPALGFSFGLERLALCMSEVDTDILRLDAFVAPIGKEEAFQAALKSAALLRSHGLRVDMGLKGMSPRALAGMSKRLKARYTVFIGENELRDENVTLRDMQTGNEEKCSLNKAVEIIKKNGVIT